MEVAVREEMGGRMADKMKAENDKVEEELKNSKQLATHKLDQRTGKRVKDELITENGT